MKNNINRKNIDKKIIKLFEKRGKKTVELAKKRVLEEKIESKEVREALHYFVTEYWHDSHRSAVLSLVSEALGTDPNITIPIAIPLTLLNGAIDIHDDIIDQTKIKRSQPTVFGKFGENVAILVGDLLLYKGFTLLHEAGNKGISAEKIAIISTIIKRTYFELGNAVAIELQFRGRIDVSSEDYLKMVRKKAAEVEALTRIGSILGNGTSEEIKALSEYGRLLGMITVLHDDLLEMFDIEEFKNRVKNEHLPLQVIYALETSMDKSELGSIFNKKIKSESDINKIVKFTNNAEGPVLVAEKIREIANEASYYLQSIQKSNKSIDYLQLILEAFTPDIIDC